jgi:acyl-CoA thioesterase FadM
LNIGGFGLIITDAVVVYKSQGYCGDVLNVAVAAGDFNTYGCDFYYRIDNKQTGKEIARAKTGIVFYDYSAGKMVHMPEVFKGLLADKI